MRTYAVNWKDPKNDDTEEDVQADFYGEDGSFLTFQRKMDSGILAKVASFPAARVHWVRLKEGSS